MTELGDFPLFKTKVKGVSKKFDLNDPKGRREYFDAKVGDEIKVIKEYLRENTFVAYLLGKKGSGKGTYTKLFIEAVGEPEKIIHVSIGDIVREASRVIEEKGKEKEKLEKKLKQAEKLIEFQKKIYMVCSSRPPS